MSHAYAKLWEPRLRKEAAKANNRNVKSSLRVKYVCFKSSEGAPFKVGRAKPDV